MGLFQALRRQRITNDQLLNPTLLEPVQARARGFVPGTHSASFAGVRGSGCGSVSGREAFGCDGVQLCSVAVLAWPLEGDDVIRMCRECGDEPAGSRRTLCWRCNNKKYRPAKGYHGPHHCNYCGDEGHNILTCKDRINAEATRGME